jgi:hypothetical protein
MMQEDEIMASLNFPLHDHCQGSVHTNVRLATRVSQETADCEP